MGTGAVGMVNGKLAAVLTGLLCRPWTVLAAVTAATSSLPGLWFSSSDETSLLGKMRPSAVRLGGCAG
jgi:hypothetical protein